jgi:hypothetical protein
VQINAYDTITGSSGLSSTGAAGGSSSGAIAVVAGRSVVGDGGGGTFYWVAGMTSPAPDDSMIVQCGSSDGRWFRLHSGPLDIRWFGASTASADNQAAIQAAIDYAFSVGGTVYIPAGVYVLQHGLTLNQNVSVTGDGTGTIGGGTGSILWYQPTDPAPAPPVITWIAMKDGNLNAVLSNFCIRSSGANTQYAILVRGAYYGTIRNLVIDGVNGGFASNGGAGIAIQCGASHSGILNSAFISISSCRIAVSGDGIQITSTDLSITGIVVRDCGIENCGGWAINAVGNPPEQTSQVMIEGNDLEGTNGITGSFIASRIAGNYFESSSVPFIDLSTIHHPDHTLACRGLVIENNYVSLGDIPYGMLLGCANTTWGLVCQGNYVGGATAAAIWLGVQAVGARISNNYVASGNIVDGIVGGAYSTSPPAYDSYGLDTRVYRFVRTHVASGLKNEAIQLDGNYAQAVQLLENPGYVLGLVAQYSQGMPGTFDLTVQASTSGQLRWHNVLNTGAVAASYCRLGSSIGPAAPGQFGAGEGLRVLLTTSSGFHGSGNLCVDVIVGYGTAGA